MTHVINFDLPSSMYGGIDEYVHRIGRTARIGHQGLATSFYDEERDADIGQALVNTLIECECEVPDFLQHLAPEEGQAPNFDDDSEEEADGEGDEGGAATNGTDAGNDDTAEDGGAAASAWTTTEAPPADDGFNADNNTAAAAVW